MPLDIWVRKGGAWVQAEEVWVRKAGAWVEATGVFVRKAGAWVEATGGGSPPPALTPPAVLAYDNSYCDFGFPVYRVWVDVTPSDATKQHRIYRNGSLRTTLGVGVTSWEDAFVSDGFAYEYTATTYDPSAPDESDPSTGSEVTPANPC